jgi:Putative beta-barrel porin-2, OmpL-like. bbp2
VSTKSCMAACLFAALVCAPVAATAQTRSIYSNLANPSIGMNALFSGQAARNLDEPYGLHFDEAEISLISVVDPYWTLVSNIVFTGDGEVDPEEVWARSTNIPGIQLKLGKIRGTFGKQGLLHTHAFPFIQPPVIMANTIGDEGFKDAGVEAAWLTPLPWYSELTGGVYQAIGADDEHPLDFGSTRHDNVPYLGHFKNLFDLNDETTLDLGQSILQGRGIDGHRHSAYGADVTVRNVPLRRSNQRGWILQSEYLQKGTTADGTYHREQNGWYALLKYRLSQIWWVGVRGEQASDSFTDFLIDDVGDPIPGKVTRGSVNIAWTPSEFSFVRLEYSHAEADGGNGLKPNDDRIMIQMSYTIGYHPAHAY